MAKRSHFNPSGLAGRWTLPDTLKQAAVTRLTMLIADIKQRPRVVIAAIRALIEISKHESDVDYQERLRDAERHNDLPMIVYSSKNDTDYMRSLELPALLEFINHPLKDEFSAEQKRAYVTTEAKQRAARSLENLESEQSLRPRAKILPVPRPNEAFGGKDGEEDGERG